MRVRAAPACRAKPGANVGEREIFGRTVVGNAKPAKTVAKALAKGAIADAPATRYGLGKAMWGKLSDYPEEHCLAQ
eukprot:1726181-Lingulodinium_polyedra.AAC.1